MPNVRGVLELYKHFDHNQLGYEDLAGEIEVTLGDPNTRIFTVEVDGQVLATAHATVIPNLVGSGHPQMVVENIITDPKHQGRGLGRLLLDQVEAWARHRECRKIIIVSNKKFSAQGFYESQNFEGKSSEVFIKRL